MERIERQILQGLLGKGEAGVYELLSVQDGSLKEFLKALESLEKKGKVEVRGDRVRMLEEGRFLPGVKCGKCRGTGYSLTFGKLLKEFRKRTKKRPPPLEGYTQAYMLEEEVVRRVEFIYERGDLQGRILVIGDDDLFSIAASLTLLPEEVVVAEIDGRLVEFLNSMARREGWRLRALVYDVRDPLPEELVGKFDVSVTEPVESLPGLELFLSRAVSALKGVGGALYFGLTTLEASRRKWLEVERRLLKMGLVITDIRRNFSLYPPTFAGEEKTLFFRKFGRATVPWYASSLIRAEVLEGPRPLVRGRKRLGKELYSDGETLATPI
ncbi:MAG: bis-aminopropyl spermidine synthase family protein [Candidatus Hadarchaeales archaeon]